MAKTVDQAFEILVRRLTPSGTESAASFYESSEDDPREWVRLIYSAMERAKRSGVMDNS